MGLWGQARNSAMQPKHLFIGGLHRSGTSLLHAVLTSHPEMTGFKDTGVPEDEGQHLQDVYPLAKQVGGPGRFCLQADGPMDEHSPLVTEENKAALLKAWEPYWQEGKVWRLEKSPPNLVRGRFLQVMVADSYFLFIVRHPAAVSFATKKWGELSIPHLMKHWQAGHAQMLKDMKHLKRAKIVRYEDMIADPQGLVDEVWHWLGLESVEVTEMVRKDGNDRYFVDWHSWRATHPYKTKFLEWGMRGLLKHFNYSLSSPFIIEEQSSSNAP